MTPETTAPAAHPGTPAPLRLSREELLAALRARGEEQRELHAAALNVKKRVYGDDVVLRGVIETGNVCRVNCTYCPMRRDNNRDNSSFFMSASEILERAGHIKDAGINVILLQAGETPKAAAVVLEALPRIVAHFDGAVEVILNLGSLGYQSYRRLREAGATTYILKHETSSDLLHAETRFEKLSQRIQEWYLARDAGFRMGTGIISGLPGQDYESLADELVFLRSMDPDMISVSPFVPAPDTPMADVPPGNVDDALNFLALTRLEHPHALIPSVSALEKNASGGQGAGIAAGANVMTINFTGDHQGEYLIYGKQRYVVKTEHVSRVLARNGARRAGSVWVGSSARRATAPAAAR
ncbi:radical SAM protein [Glycomyces sp. TRM65418]|uniref:biotin synthase BioB n=1 Tax=Glycomyces sp. TRM65418 TaxID=2867006 RepID=UPI001CE4CC64|nr:radical SAM protein [Glycomyces sp. TRM65418]MCC3765506.1 radical SAM protein [Glycomyces sp. TRM65418]QZD55113.1 radical SAM protein [Glycomyces sp. TRM65418]